MFSIGMVSIGPFSVGIFSVGLFSIGFFSIGICSVGHYALGMWAWGIVVGYWKGGQGLESVKVLGAASSAVVETGVCVSLPQCPLLRVSAHSLASDWCVSA